MMKNVLEFCEEFIFYHFIQTYALGRAFVIIYTSIIEMYYVSPKQK